EIERRRQRCTVLGAVGAFDHREQLDTIACGEDEGLADAGLVREGARSVGKPCDGYGEALAHVEWSCRVIHADEEQGAELGLITHGTYGALNLWTTESELAAQTARTMRKTNPER